MVDTHKKFEEFVSTCSSLLRGENAQFLALIKKRYDGCSQAFRASTEMADLLEVTRVKVLSEPKKLFVHLRDFVTELKAWGAKNEGQRKRKAQDPLEAVAKMARVEDSTSEGSDMEGKLQRALGTISASPSSWNRTASPSGGQSTADVCKTVSPSACENVSPLPLVSGVTVTSQAEDSKVTVNGHSLSACGDETSQSSPSKETSSGTLQTPESSSLTEGTSLTQLSSTADDNCNTDTSGDSAKKVESNKQENCNEDNASSALPVPKSDSGVSSDSRPRASENCPDGDMHNISDPRKVRSGKLRITPTQLKCLTVPKSLATIASHNSTAGPSFTSSKLPHPGTQPPRSSKTQNLKKTVDRLKNHLAVSPSLAPPASPPLFDMTCEDSYNAADDDNDVILVEDDDGEELGEVRLNCKGAARKAAKGRTETGRTSGSGKTISTRREEAGSWPACSSSTEGVPPAGPSGDATAGKATKEQKHIKRLEKLLEKIRDKIEEIRDKDLSLEDLDAQDSPYIFEDSLQKKFIKVWNKLCQMKGRKTSSGRPIERRFKYEGTRFPEINKKIQKFVNRPDCFPDYHDVKGIVKKVNTRCQLGLNAMQINDISREAFLDIGETLQKRRHEDFISTFRSRQTETFCADRDPALFDDELRRKLEENSRVGRSRLEEVISKYSNLQMQMAEAGEKDSEGSHDEHSEGSGEGEEGKGQMLSKVKVTEKSPARDGGQEDYAAADSDSGAMIEMDVAEESGFMDEEQRETAELDTSAQVAFKSFDSSPSPSKRDSCSESKQPSTKKDDTKCSDDNNHENDGEEKDRDFEKSEARTSSPAFGEEQTSLPEADYSLRDSSKNGDKVGGKSSEPSDRVLHNSSKNTLKHDSKTHTTVNGESDGHRSYNNSSPFHNSHLTSKPGSSTHSLPATKTAPIKSRSPVKISTSLKLPNFLFRRNGKHSPPKPETFFYPEKNHSSLGSVAGDGSVTVICSSDEEEVGGNRNVKTEFSVKNLKKEPVFFSREDDVIELLDSD